jgi:hypothetical protein
MGCYGEEEFVILLLGKPLTLPVSDTISTKDLISTSAQIVAERLRQKFV